MTELSPWDAAAQAYHLRVAGKDFTEIAADLDISVPQAVKMYRDFQMDLLRDVGLDTREQAQYLELERLDRMMLPFFAAACEGDKEGADVALKIMALRMKLLRLDQPMPTDDGVKVQTIVVTGTREEFVAALSEGRMAGIAQDDGGDEEDSEDP